MSVLEASVLNWFQFQFSKETVMDMNMNSLVWMLIVLAHGITVRFQYQNMFGWQIMELHSTLFYMHQITVCTMCDYGCVRQ